MKKVYIVAHSIVSPLGMGSLENYERIRNGITGLAVEQIDSLSTSPICISRMKSIPAIDSLESLTRFETLALHALRALRDQVRWPSTRTIFILASTKGNIEVLETGQPDHPRIHLHAVARFLASQTGLPSPIVISNACISGVSALVVAQRLMGSGQADHAVILGADVLSRFVVSGFQSLQAISAEPCQPFDVARKGTNLGEAAAAIFLSTTPDAFGVNNAIVIAGGGLSNDANHISGPSRTGAELTDAINQACTEAEISTSDIDFVSAHGTATIYNDEMEAKAFNLASLQSTPVQSLKGYYGHTLGAAGVLETVLTSIGLQRGEQIPTKGFETAGIVPGVKVSSTFVSKAMSKALKTASGFGGCNAALVLVRSN